MKIDARGTNAFLKDPGATRLVLLYGDDEGLIRERAQALTRTIAGTLNDPFRVAELDRDGWPQIAGEMAALSMIGGRRVIRVRESTDAIVTFLVAALKTRGDALVVLEAPGLGRGKLRTLAENTPDAAAIACYPEEGRALDELIRGMFSAEKIAVDHDALSWLAESLGGDRSVVRGEIEKLVLLAGPNGTIDLDAARSATGDASTASGDEAMSAATAGNLQAADAAVEAAIADGLNPVALMRMALSHLQKLHQARLQMAQGQSAADAVRAMRPPVFFRAVPAMTAALSLWPEDALLSAIGEARATELACKQTGARQELLARRFVTTLARQGQARKRAGSARSLPLNTYR